MMDFGGQELEQPSASLDFEFQVESEPESLNVQSKLQISLAQSYPLNFTRVSSSSIEYDHGLQAVTRPQCSSACTKNLEIIRASLRRSFIKLDDGVERCVSDDVYAHAGEANHPISRVLSGYLHDMLIQHAPKLNLEYLMRGSKPKLIPATSYESRTMTCVLWMRRIECPSRSMLLDSGSDSNTENVWQVPGLELPNIQSILHILLAQSYPLVLTNAPSIPIELYHRLSTGTKFWHFSVRSACIKDLEVVCAFLRRPILNFDDGTDHCISGDGYLHAEEAEPPLTHVSAVEFHDISTQHAWKWDFGYLTGIFELKPVPASSYEFSTMGSVPWMSRIQNPRHSMLICSGFDLNVENVQQALNLALCHGGSDELGMVMGILVPDTSFEWISWSLFVVIESAFLFKSTAQRACRLFTYLVVWALKNYIAHVAR